jgi:hypothetical protein
MLNLIRDPELQEELRLEAHRMAQDAREYTRILCAQLDEKARLKELEVVLKMIHR